MAFMYNPNNLSPSGTAIDADITNLLSWESNGTPQTDFQVFIYNNTTGLLIYDSTKTSSSNEYLTLTSSTLTNGTEYKWIVQTWSGTTTVTSDYEFFIASSTPEVSFIDPSSFPDTLSTQDYTFILNYTQDEDTPLKKYKFILYDETDTELLDSDWIYNFDLSYEFTGMVNFNTYKIEGIVVSQYDIEETTGLQEIFISYNVPDNIPNIILTPNNVNGSIVITWDDLKQVIPTTSGYYTYIEGKFNQGLQLDTSSIIEYSETFDDNYTFTFWLKLYKTFDGTIMRIGTNKIFGYERSTKRFYFNESGSYTYSDAVELFTWLSLDGYTWDDLDGYDWEEIIDYGFSWLFIGITNEYIIIKKDNTLLTEMYIDSSTNAFSSVVFYGNIKIDNLHAQTTMLSYVDLLTQDYRLLKTNDYSTPFLFESNNTQIKFTLKLDDTRLLLTYYNATSFILYFVITDFDGTILSSTSTISTTSGSINMVKMDTDKVLVTFLYGGLEGRSFILTTISNIIVQNTFTVFSNNLFNYITIDKIDDNFAIIAYNDTDNTTSKIQILTIVGNTIFSNISGEVEYNNNGATSFNNIHILNSTTGIIFYKDSSDSSGKAQFITYLDDDIVSIGTRFTFDSTVSYINTIKINENKMIITYTKIGYGCCRLITLTETGMYVRSINYLEDSPTETISSLSISEISNDNLYLITFSLGTNKYGFGRLLDVNENNIQLENLEQFTSLKVSNLKTVSSNLQVFIAFNTYDTNYGYHLIADNFIESATKLDYEQIWGDNTNFLANYENTLNAGNISSDTIGWRVKRKAEDLNLFTTLSTISDRSITTYTDYLPRNNINYTYSVYALSNYGESLGLQEISNVSFYGWILTDGTVSYKFDMGLNGIETNNISNNKNQYIYENYTQYPIVSFGQQNYKTSSLKTIPYTLSDTISETSLCYEINETVRQIIEDFINNDGEKWLKNTAGEIFKVVTFNFNYKYLDKIQEQPHEISFDWIEIGIGEE